MAGPSFPLLEGWGRCRCPCCRLCFSLSSRRAARDLLQTPLGFVREAEVFEGGPTFPILESWAAVAFASRCHPDRGALFAPTRDLSSIENAPGRSGSSPATRTAA